MGKIAKSTQIKTFCMASGERYCVLIDQRTGIPLSRPNLFVTTQIRNRSLSLSAMEAALNGIQILLVFCEDRGIDLEGRFLRCEFFRTNELDSIRDFCQKRFEPGKSSAESKVLKFEVARTRVEKATEYSRLTEVAEYLEWLSGYLARGAPRFSGLDNKYISVSQSRRESTGNAEMGLPARSCTCQHASWN